MLKNIFHKINILFSERKKFWGITVMILLLLIPLEFFIFSAKMTDEDDLYWKSFLANNKIYGVMIPKDLQFANEKVPVFDFTVIESMERELLVNTYFHSQTILMHKRANRWLPLIADILKKNGVPDDFKYIALIESNLTNSVSPKGATGYWQFLDGSAKQYGLEVNEEVDERYNVEKSTEAACRYFKDAYKTFGNWTLAAASYNVGIDGLKKQIDRQKASSYYDLALNEETARYIFRILAVKEVISNPKKYGYQLRKKDLYPSIPTQEIKIDSSITDLADFAQTNNLSYKILKYFNPWLRKNYLTNKDKKTYIIEIPKPGYNEEYIARLSSSDSLGMRTETYQPEVPITPHDSLRQQ
ncbi:MAG: lytic transglycosylase domain-containing protein [Bacteroidetes bacterium]|nr:lytic transglycosylase domain-containing protein [Bacteroidota bacterium]